MKNIIGMLGLSVLLGHAPAYGDEQGCSKQSILQVMRQRLRTYQQLLFPAREHAGFWFVPDGPALDFSRIRALREEMIAHPERVSLLQDGSAEGILAAFEAQSARAGVGQMDHFEDILRDNLGGQRKAIERHLASLRLRDTTSDARFGAWIETLYTLQNQPRTRGARFRQSVIGTPPARLIRHRVQRALLEQNLTRGLQDLGLVRAPHFTLERIQAFRREHRVLEDSLLQTAISGAISHMAHAVVPPVPGGIFTAAHPVPAALLEKVRLHGFESAVPELRAYFGSRPNVDYLIDRTRALFARGLIAYGAYMTVQFYPQVSMMVGMATVTEEDIRRYEEETFDPARIRREQFESWREGFKVFEGHYPDPNNPDEARQIAEEQRRINALPDSALRVAPPSE